MCLRELCLFRVRAYSLASLAVARLMFTVTEPNYEEKSRAQAKRPHHTHTHTHDHLSLGPILAYPTATRLRAKVVSQKGTRESRLKVDGPCQSTWKLSLKTYNYYYHQRLCVSRQTVIIIHVPFRRQALFSFCLTTTTTAKTKLLVHTWWTKSFVTWQRIWCRLNDRWFPNRASLVE